MIEDPHERTRAILWLLADARPDMTVLAALGHLKAIEAQLDVLEAREKQEAKRGPAKYRGAAGVPQLVRDAGDISHIRDEARAGNITATAGLIASSFSAGAMESMQAAKTLVSLHKDDGHSIF